MERNIIWQKFVAYLSKNRVIREILPLLLIIAGLLYISYAATIPPPFVIDRVPPEISAPLIELAVLYKDTLSRDWFGEIQTWKSSCHIYFKLNEGIPRGLSTFSQLGRQTRNMSITISGGTTDIFDNVLPHEIMHMVIANHYNKNIPRWADEGMAMSVEVRDHPLKLMEVTNFAEIMTRKDYPKMAWDIVDFYTQSELMVIWFVEMKGKKVFVEFVGELPWDNKVENINKVLRKYYQFDSVDAAQEKWKLWAQPFIWEVAGTPSVPVDALK